MRENEWIDKGGALPETFRVEGNSQMKGIFMFVPKNLRLDKDSEVGLRA